MWSQICGHKKVVTTTNLILLWGVCISWCFISNYSATYICTTNFALPDASARNFQQTGQYRQLLNTHL